MPKISTYPPNLTPANDDLIISVDVSDGDNKTLTVDQLAGLTSGLTLTAARNGNISNAYLRSVNGTPTNTVPLRLPFDCTLIAMSMQTAGVETWTAEIRIGGVLVTGAFLTTTSATGDEDNSFDIDFSKGDLVQVYVNGSSINKPSVILQFKQRIT